MLGSGQMISLCLCNNKEQKSFYVDFENYKDEDSSIIYPRKLHCVGYPNSSVINHELIRNKEYLLLLSHSGGGKS